MAINGVTDNVTSRHWLRIPTPETGANHELFIFSGIAIFGNQLKGTGSSWDGGTAFIHANYQNVIPSNRAILTRQWVVDVHLASIFNANVANNTGWAVDNYSLTLIENPDGTLLSVAGGILVLRAEIAVRDIDAFLHRLSYQVTIQGSVIPFTPPFP
jgi:hypothetical protein